MPEQQNHSASLLIVEDDDTLRTTMCDILESCNYHVQACGLAGEADRLVQQYAFHIIVLDIGLPDGDGFNLCKTWRQQQNIESMILMLTARDSEQDMLAGFAAGADDYIVKPYPLTVFLSRIQALLRRQGTSQNNATEPPLLPGFDINTQARQVHQQQTGEEIILTKIEYDLLLYFITNKNRALSYDEIISNVWGPSIIVVQGAIRNTVSSLRKKLNNNQDAPNWRINTLRSIGYRMEIEEYN